MCARLRHRRRSVLGPAGTEGTGVKPHRRSRPSSDAVPGSRRRRDRRPRRDQTGRDEGRGRMSSLRDTAPTPGNLKLLPVKLLPIPLSILDGATQQLGKRQAVYAVGGIARDEVGERVGEHVRLAAPSAGAERASLERRSILWSGRVGATPCGYTAGTERGSSRFSRSPRSARRQPWPEGLPGTVRR